MDRQAEAEIAERLLGRDERALREVIADYGGPVLGMARKIVAEQGFAEEVAQDTFVALWRRPGAFDAERGSLQSFLMGIARNKAIDLVRHEESLKRTKEALTAEMGALPETLGWLDATDERDRVRRALEQLTGLQREAIVLAYFGGRTYREVALELGIPEGTAKTRLRDGLARLKELMATPERGGA